MFKLHSFIPFLKFLCPMLFAAGADVLGALGGGEAVVIESSTEGGGEGEDGGSESTGGENGAEAAGAEGEEGQGGEGEGKEGKQRTQGRERAMPEMAKPLSPKEKAALNTLKQNDPEAWKALSRRIWGLNTVEKQIAENFGDGGLEEAIQTKSTLDNFLQKAGYPDLAGVESELQEYRSADGKILKGDATFLNDLPEEVQGGLFKMAPEFIGQWSKRDPEGYERFFLPIVLATLRDSGVEDIIRYSLRDLQRMGMDNADVKALYDQLKPASDWLDTNKEKIRKPPEKKPQAQTEDPKTQERLNRAEQIERSQALGRVGSQVNTTKGPAMSKALAAHFGGKIPGYVNKGEVIVRARVELAKLLGRGYSDKLDQYMESGDEAGAIKFTLQQITEQRIQTAVERAAKYLYGQPTLGSNSRNQQGGGNNNQNQGQRGAGKAGAGTPGVTTLKYNPRPTSIDLAASDKWAKELGISRSRLFTSNRAVVKGKGRCTWAQDAESEE